MDFQPFTEQIGYGDKEDAVIDETPVNNTSTVSLIQII